jgi:glycosyltransferase involved in cell wall biosynthesis
MKILFVIDFFKPGAGASNALLYHVNRLQELVEDMDYSIITRSDTDYNKTITIKSPDELPKKIEFTGYDIIHYFKSTRYDLFKWVMMSKQVSCPVMTTICQNPTSKGLLLSPLEIKKSNMFVFIDKSSYKSKLLNFIDERDKRMIYLGFSNEIFDITRHIIENRQKSKSDLITFGRGSTLNKCPKDVIEVFQSISIPNKRFIICGIPENSWLSDEALKYSNVTTIPHLPHNEWLVKCSEFDIFLYYIPKDIYSSVDGTLGAAMLLEIPVVYYGPDAPAEMIEHGESGFIANDKDEMLEYCELLSSDYELRVKIGKRARVDAMRKFPGEKTMQQYMSCYKTLIDDGFCKTIQPVPLWYKIYFMKSSWRQIIKSYIKNLLYSFNDFL